MSLSDLEIKTELNNNIVIYPFNPDQLGSNSYDVTLGEYYYRHIQSIYKCMNTENGERICEYWGATSTEFRYGAKQAKEIDSIEDANHYGVNIGDKIIVIDPGELILCNTNEIVGTKNYYTTSIQSRSTAGRIGLTICKDASLGSIGFINRWTLEIENHSRWAIALKVGQRIAQIMFFRTGPVGNSYAKTGQYGSGNNVEEIMKNWSPLCMLPGVAVNYLKKQMEPVPDSKFPEMKTTDGKSIIPKSAPKFPFMEMKTSDGRSIIPQSSLDADLKWMNDNVARQFKIRKSNLKFIIDFDYTITKRFASEGKNNHTTYSALRAAIGKEIEEKGNTLYSNYAFKLQDYSGLYSDKKKAQLCEEWYEKTHELFIEKCHKKHLENITIPIREYVKEIFDFCADYGIPIIVFSTGIYNVIFEILKKEYLMTSNVLIAANVLHFGEDDFVKGFSNPVIHDWNKRFDFITKVIEIKGYQDFEKMYEYSKRTDLILIGDNEIDINMAVGMENVQRELRVGLNNLNQSKFPYTLKIENDGSLKPLYDILIKE